MPLEIWKLTLEWGHTNIKMPDHARVLSTAFQGENLRIWAVVVPSNMQRERGFSVIATGEPNDKAIGNFVGTAFHPAGLVFHVFDHGYASSPQGSADPSEAKS